MPEFHPHATFRQQGDSESVSRRQLLEALPMAAYTGDRTGRITAFNQQGVRLWGRTPSPNDMGNRHVGSFELFTSAGAPIPLDECWAAKAMEENTVFYDRQAVVLRPDGEQRFVLVHASPLYNDSGAVIGGMSTFVDVTEQNTLKNALRESESRLQLALAASAMGIWEWDLRTNEAFRSPECYAILGADKFELTFPAFQRLVHPDDLRLVIAASERAILNKSTYRAEFRILRSDGRVRWAAHHGRTDYDQHGVPRRLIGTLRDVTDQKQAAAALEGKKRVLEQIAVGASQSEILEEIVAMVENQLPGSLGSILLLDDDGQ